MEIVPRVPLKFTSFKRRMILCPSSMLACLVPRSGPDSMATGGGNYVDSHSRFGIYVREIKLPLFALATVGMKQTVPPALMKFLAQSAPFARLSIQLAAIVMSTLSQGATPFHPVKIP